MIRILTCIALATGAWLAMPTPAHAAESYDNCTGFISSLPATISTQGTWCLDKDLATGMTSGYAITIAANNVTLDCNHFKIGGLGAGAGTYASGIHAWRKLNATVRNCNIRGFHVGLSFNDGGGHLAEDNTFDGNKFAGIWVSSNTTTIRNNLIINTGGSTNNAYAYGIGAEIGVDILDNTVDGVAPMGPDSPATGIYATAIYTDGSGSGNVNGNRVRGLVPTGAGSALGIIVTGPGRSVIRGNDVQGPSAATGRGIYCGSSAATARDNVIAGFGTGIETCFSDSNIVNEN